MTVKVKITIVAIIVLVTAGLFGVALTDKAFFTTLYLDQGEITENTDGSSVFPFYLYKDAWQKYQANVLNLTFNSVLAKDDLVLVTLELTPGHRYCMDSLRLEFYVNNVYSAILMADPESGEDLPYHYKLSGNDSKAVLDIPSFDTEAGENIFIRFWLDLSAVSSIEQGPILMDLSMHENSVLKIVRHTVEQHVLQLIIPD
ncbi:MAG: hypothetical protein WC231_03015 [Dehalococcoidales bacterium]|jgi:hypothetical protein|nr:hypothetical protein [Dehalococcoidales bacterium]MDD5604954.1 hypothetical protein [Dehalococcoidales bacterium]MDX9986722.1 hypothetical protein [Dehalococcoidales bacterium]NLE89543.1 hypothetical protein [Dehalococcoidales bacterium]